MKKRETVNLNFCTGADSAENGADGIDNKPESVGEVSEKTMKQETVWVKQKMKQKK